MIKIDFDSEDLGVYGIKVICSYICSNYQIESNIIRNRRQILEHDDEEEHLLASRELVELVYTMESEKRPYEQLTYEKLSKWIMEGLASKTLDLEQDIKPLLLRFFSSPWAFVKQINSMDIDDEIIENAEKWIEDEKYNLKHIEDILRDGHIDYSVKMAVKLGLDPIRAIKMAAINTAKCYGLKHLGAISPGFQADFVVLDNLTDLNVTDVFYKGKRLNEDAPIRVRPCSHVLKHTVHLDKVKAERFLLPISKKKTHVIEIHAGQITTTDLTISLPPTLNFEPFGGYSKLQRLSGITIQVRSALRGKRVWNPKWRGGIIRVT